MKKLPLLLSCYLVLQLLGSCNRNLHGSGQVIEGTYQILRIKDEPLNDSTNISGYVTSKLDSTSLPGASVFILNPTTGIQTDDRGYFEFMVNSGTYEFGTQYVGFDNLKIPKLECNPNERIILLIELGTTIHHL